jgi:hypothetical protein
MSVGLSVSWALLSPSLEVSSCWDTIMVLGKFAGWVSQRWSEAFPLVILQWCLLCFVRPVLCPELPVFLPLVKNKGACLFVVDPLRLLILDLGLERHLLRVR